MTAPVHTPRIYMDHNATAPLRAEARAAMVGAMDLVGNASSVHADGRRARAVIEQAREHVATLLGARPADVVFTSGASEANAAVMTGGWDTIFVSGQEHPSVLEPARRSGAHMITLPTDAHGVTRTEVAADHVLRSSKPLGRALVSLQIANSETGVVQHVGETAAFAQSHGLAMHTDAVQGPGRFDIRDTVARCHYVSVSAHKMGGPKGVGALVLRDGAALRTFLVGGGQERGRRGGTENVAAIAGFGAAAAAVLHDRDTGARQTVLRDTLEAAVLRANPQAVVLGQGSDRLCNTSCLAVPGLRAETLLIKLDLAGISVSAGSACSSGKVGASAVLAAMGVPRDISMAAIRVSIGPGTTEQDVATFLAAWTEITTGYALAA
jgi:cysteine desulfurase